MFDSDASLFLSDFLLTSVIWVFSDNSSYFPLPNLDTPITFTENWQKGTEKNYRT